MSIIAYLTTIRFEAGALHALPDDLRDLGIRSPMIVTDRGLVEVGLVAKVQSALQRGISAPVFSDTPSNPTEDAVEAGLALYRTGGCDGIVAVGGGSPIDLAKAIALLATHPGPLAPYAFIAGGGGAVTAAVAPVIAIPTTAGTGSEVGRAALITLRDGRKLGFISQHLIPKRAVCDPDLTLGLPPDLTAATGMDAITHCIETFLSPRDNPPAEAIALDGLDRAVRHIERAVSDGDDRDARREMMMAALEGGLTFQKGLGAVHALSHPLGGLKGPPLHHGTLNAVLLPHVLRFNEGHVRGKYAVLRRVLRLGEDADLAASVEALNRRIGLPRSLAQMGVPRAVLPGIARHAVADHSTPTNPRKADEADYLALLDAAYD